MKSPWLAACGLFVLLPAAAGAHEIGTTDVRFAVHADGTWSANITTGPQSLEAEAGLPRTSNLDADALRRRLEPLLPRVARDLDVRFDGAPSSVAVSIARLSAPADITQPSFVVLSAGGAVPHGAVNLVWRDRLVYSTYALVAGRDGDPLTTTVWIEGDASSEPVALAGRPPPGRLAVVGQYLLLGFEHILPKGLDHILFVLGIFLLATSIRPILVQVTSFTLAHSLTLGLTMYGIVSLPPRIVEPLIALSIAYVAIENILTTRLTPWRPVVVFGFGLLHGMGFAGVLKNLQLPRGEFIPALVSFNVGIEVAQLTVIGAAFLCVALGCRGKPWYRARVAVPASGLIALTGLVWTIQRAAGL
jgi:hydrogenase/urease accessory protein HupE